MIGFNHPTSADGGQGGDQGEGQGHARQHRQSAADKRLVGAGKDEGQDRQDAGAGDGQDAAEIGQKQEQHLELAFYRGVRRLVA